jgi:uncharacterized protein (TIGR00369 family)
MSGVPLPNELESAIRENFARAGFIAGLGITIADLERGICSLAMPVSKAVSQQQGFVHGGAIGTIADTAGGYASLTLLPPFSEVLTLEYKINFLSPASGETIIALAKVIKPGRRVFVTRVDVFAIDGEERRHCAALQQSISAHLAKSD